MINGQPRRNPLKDTTNYRPGLPPPPSPCGSCTKPPIPASPPLLVCLLYVGTYLFVGAPKVGNSFLMAQFAYQVSTGQPMWGYPVRKGSVLYLALEDDTATSKVDSIGCLGQTVPRVCLRRRRQAPGRGLTEQLEKFLREHLDSS